MKTLIKIRLNGSVREFSMRSDEPILEKALDEGIDLSYSCESGLCTSCMCKLVSGTVEMEDADGLTDGEKDEGYVLICVARPTSEYVELIAD